MDLDRETTQILNEGERIAHFVQGDDWRWLKDLFTNKILDLQSIKNLDLTKTATTIQKEIGIRNTVVDILMEIIKEVEGRASQHSGNNIVSKPENSHILNLE